MKKIKIFNMPISNLKGIGKTTELLFKKLNITNIGELLTFFPVDYEDWNNIKNIEECYEKNSVIQIEVLQEYSCITSFNNKKIYKVKCFEVNNIQNLINITFFNNKFTPMSMKKNQKFLAMGEVKIGYNNIYELINPKIKLLNNNNNNFKLEPVYSQTKNLSSLRIKKFILEALKFLPEKISETIPEEFLKKFDLPTLDFVIKKIHFPKSKDEIYIAKKRIIFEELVSWILSVKKIKNYYKSNFIINNFFDEFKKKLEFNLTNSQEKIILECVNEMSNGKKMSRLLQGDVGSGKTVIAMALAYNTLKSGLQVAFMVPTEVLAIQHYNNFSKIIGHENIYILTGSTRTKERDNIITKFMIGMPGILIGTHSLISDNIEFKRLALVITDEQHKFGVEQRKKLLNKGDAPHYLVMSATPIPRSLAMIIYGDLDISVIDEMPKNRTKIKTKIIESSQRVLAFKFIKKELSLGNHAYIVCTRVTENNNKNNNKNNELTESTEADVENYKEKIIKNYFENFNIGILHGKMSSYEKDFILKKFYDKKIDLLICTTVIEVGIDVPNATVIMIENAEKFGLASLHQMRGRVGRSEKESYCILICNKKSKNIIERLTTMQKSSDGFYLAHKDLEIRGPGNFFGTEQHGKLSASLINSLKDSKLISQANEFINFILKSNFKFKPIKFFNQNS